jgi:hypothetical protein
MRKVLVLASRSLARCMRVNGPAAACVTLRVLLQGPIAAAGILWVFVPVTRRYIPRTTYLTRAVKSVPHGAACGQYRQHGPGES